MNKEEQRNHFGVGIGDSVLIRGEWKKIVKLSIPWNPFKKIKIQDHNGETWYGGGYFEPHEIKFSNAVKGEGQ